MPAFCISLYIIVTFLILYNTQFLLLSFLYFNLPFYNVEFRRRTFLLCDYSKRERRYSLHPQYIHALYTSPLNNSVSTPLFRRWKSWKCQRVDAINRTNTAQIWFIARGPPSFSFPITGKYSPRPSRSELMYVFVFAIHACQPACVRFAPSDSGMWIKQAANIRNSSDARSALGVCPGVCPECTVRNIRTGWKTAPFPRRVCHLQRKLNDSAQFAWTRSVRCTFVRELQRGAAGALFFPGSITPSPFSIPPRY